MKKKTAFCLGFGISVTILVFTGQCLLDYALKAGNLSVRINSIEGSLNYIHQAYPEVGHWVDSLQKLKALHNHYIENGSKTKLHAYCIPAVQPTQNTAIIIHGYKDNAAAMLMIGFIYSKELGYNVLLPNLYAHGLSDGNEVQMGWKDRWDILRWINEAKQLFGNDSHFVIHGISMGAATAMCAAGEISHEGIHGSPVRCVVEDCGYSSVWEEFKKELKGRFNLPAFPILHIANILCDIKYGWNFREASPLEQVKECTLPMLFIHGSNDTFVPTQMVYPLYEAKSNPKALWIVPGAGHGEAYAKNPQTYSQKIREFVTKYMEN